MLGSLGFFDSPESENKSFSMPFAITSENFYPKDR
jgi:hypothetical protein